MLLGFFASFFQDKKLSPEPDRIFCYLQASYIFNHG